MNPADRPVAFITGASGGLGQALVKAFRAAGWRVAAGWCHSIIPAEGDFTVPVHLNVAEPTAPKRAVESVIERWGRIDVLVNNAGVTADEILPLLSVVDWDRVLAVNLTGAFRCCRAVLRPMVRQGSGHILNIGSYVGSHGAAGQIPYAAAKAGLLGLAQSLAAELGPRNIRVNTILPGVMRTTMTAKLPEKRLAELQSANVLGRLNQPEEVARFAAFLAGLEHVSGQVFQLDSRLSAAF